jgi:hypothetical protein
MSGLAGAGYAASMLVATAGLIALSRGGGGDADDDGSGGEEEEEEEAGVEVMVDQGAAATMKAVDQTALPLGTAAMSPAARASMLAAPLMGGDGLGGGGSAGLSLDAQLGAMDSPEDRYSSTCSSETLRASAFRTASGKSCRARAMTSAALHGRACSRRRRNTKCIWLLMMAYAQMSIAKIRSRRASSRTTHRFRWSKFRPVYRSFPMRYARRTQREMQW